MAALGTGYLSRSTSSSFLMAQLLSRHLWNAALLVGSASVALAAERLVAAPARLTASGASENGGLPDIGNFVARTWGDPVPSGLHAYLPVDPFDSRPTSVEQSGVASQADVPTVPSSIATGPRLTAILVAAERRVAVIDDATVSVGDVLPDGARVSAIQPDRVWVVEKDGRWRMLTLTNRGTR